MKSFIKINTRCDYFIHYKIKELKAIKFGIISMFIWNTSNDEITIIDARNKIYQIVQEV